MKLKIFMNNVTSCLNKQREVCSDSISSDYEKSLACFWLLYSIFGPLGQTASKILASGRYPGLKKHAVVLVTCWDPNAMLTVLDLIFSIFLLVNT